MKVLTLDIETRPLLSRQWGLRNQFISHGQMLEPTGVICFAAKWLDRKGVMFFSDFHNGHSEMVDAAHSLLSEADVVVGYNSKRFDIPHLEEEIALSGGTPPAPFAQVDLYQVARNRFRLPSNKLDYVAQRLSIGQKVKHEGFDLWLKCLAGDPKAWAKMKRYNVGDVRLTEDAYVRLLPWIRNHPHVGLFDGPTDACPRCGSGDRQRRGQRAASALVYQQYQCNACGGWYRGARAIHPSTETRLA